MVRRADADDGAAATNADGQADDAIGPCPARIKFKTPLMPTVMRIGAFRFHFYSDEGSEPSHIHVRTPDGECKFWLEPIALASAKGIKPHDIRAIERLVFEHKTALLSAYHEFQRDR